MRAALSPSPSRQYLKKISQLPLSQVPVPLSRAEVVVTSLTSLVVPEHARTRTGKSLRGLRMAFPVIRGPHRDKFHLHDWLERYRRRISSAPRARRSREDVKSRSRLAHLHRDPSLDRPPPVEFPVGASPFHKKGISYIGSNAFVQEHIPGGLAAVLAELPDDLKAFF